jgi:hypothetical protein
VVDFVDLLVGLLAFLTALAADKIIATAYENGHPTVLPVALLRVLEENLRSFEKYRLLILDQIKKAQAQSQ